MTWDVKHVLLIFLDHPLRRGTMSRSDIKIAAVMEEATGRIFLFRPNVPASALSRIAEVLESRWIGQGPKVEEFERSFEKKFNHTATAVSCGSGTDALHLAYLLSYTLDSNRHGHEMPFYNWWHHRHLILPRILNKSKQREIVWQNS